MSLRVRRVVCLRRVCIYVDRSIFWNWTGGSVTAKPGTMLLKPISHGAHLLSHPSSSIHPSIHELFLLIIWSHINCLSGFILPSLQLCFLDFNFFTALVWVCIYLIYLSSTTIALHTLLYISFVFLSDISDHPGHYQGIKDIPSLCFSVSFFNYFIIYSTAGRG